MATHYYILAALMAAVLMALELRLSEARGIAAYSLPDTVSSLSNFMGEMVLMVVLYLNVFLGYGLLEARVALFHPSPSSWVTWVAAFVAVDFLYYWGHRACHRMSVLWALHVVHHQSPEYNIGVGLRGPWLSALQIAPFMIPLALAGVPTTVLFPLYGVHTVWKLLVHTRLVGKLGWLEHVLVTPSQHRVHHGTNARFLDRNFGGFFCVWDHLFGTFQVEDEVPVYGIGTPLSTLDPIRNNLDPWRDLVASARRTEGATGPLRALFAPPGSHPASDAGARAEAEVSAPRRAAELPRGARLFVIAQAAVAGIATLAFMRFGEELPVAARLAAGASILGVLVYMNSFVQRRS